MPPNVVRHVQNLDDIADFEVELICLHGRAVPHGISIHQVSCYHRLRTLQGGREGGKRERVKKQSIYMWEQHRNSVTTQTNVAAKSMYVCTDLVCVFRPMSV